LYLEWIDANDCGHPANADLCDAYLTSLLNYQPPYEITTIVKKRSYLQQILSEALKANVFLKKFHIPEPTNKKYCMNPDQEEEFLNKIEDSEDHLIAKLGFEYGCRVHDIANMKVRHLDFLENTSQSKILIPDSKRGINRSEDISPDLITIIKEHISDKNLEGRETFLFTAGKTTTPVKRAVALRKHMSRVVKKNTKSYGNNFVKASSIFRNTKANIAYRIAEDEGMKVANVSIGHTSNSKAIRHYIMNAKTINNDFLGKKHKLVQTKEGEFILPKPNITQTHNCIRTLNEAMQEKSMTFTDSIILTKDFNINPD
jgi:integrase